MHGIQLCDIQKRRHEAASNADHALISDMCKYVLVTSGGEAVRGQNELEQDGWDLYLSILGGSLPEYFWGDLCLSIFGGIYT